MIIASKEEEGYPIRIRKLICEICLIKSGQCDPPNPGSTINSCLSLYYNSCNPGAVIGQLYTQAQLVHVSVNLRLYNDMAWFP